ncbi:hypothetical protein J437_LFUL002562 [Ladona fulva]|uniref:Carboxylesterase type B domain-containing protein n=1 Tax=Ladona fulva TaxID=123851 RepID=A0A8K0JX50_LADFU|nr:hypothetical protein J437_LFUL002562 [Ladona fulva]
MRVPGSERRPRNSDAAFFLLMLLLPLPLPLPSAARALSPSSTSSPPLHSPPPSSQRFRKSGGQANSYRQLSPRVVQTQQGALRGIVLELRGLGNRAAAASARDSNSRSHQQQQLGLVPQLDPVEAFWGVRYAKPPVGELRFAAPQAPDKWEGVEVADAFAPVCPQVYV